MKYTTTKITFQEIPDEVSLCINISNCKIKCKGCHSPELQTNIGNPLNENTLNKLIITNKGITCVCFMGGEMHEIYTISKWLKSAFPSLKIGWYTGNQYLPLKEVLSILDYIKIGPYIEEKGPITVPTTNQRLYKIIHRRLFKDKVINITSCMQ